MWQTWSWPGLLAMSLIMMFFWGSLAWILLEVRDGGFGRRAGHDPKDVLDARLARGDIDAQEYRTRVEALWEADDE